MQITIPAVPDGAEGWRKTVAGINPEVKGGYAVHGDWLPAGALVDAPVSTVILAVDKTSGGGTATLYTVEVSGLAEAWSKTFKNNPVTQATLSKASGLVTASIVTGQPSPWHAYCARCSRPAPSGTGVFANTDGDVVHAECPPPGHPGPVPGKGVSGVTVISQPEPAANAPQTVKANRYPGTCTECQQHVAAGAGQLIGKKVRHVGACPAPGATPTSAPRRRGHGQCAECASRTGYNLRQDSSGISGYVCDRCNRSADYELSFA